MAVDWDEAVIGPNMEIFGESATYFPATGPSFPINGIFDEAYREVNLIDNSVDINSEQPVLGVQLSQFSVAPAQNDTLSIASANSTFLVREVRLDGHGDAKLMLSFMSSP